MAAASFQSRARPAARRAPAEELFRRPVVCVLGLPFDAIDLTEAVESLRAAAFSNKRCFVSTPNLNFLIAARRDAAFRDSVLRSDLVLPDGAPIVWIARALGVPLKERVAGSSVFEALRAHPGPPLTVFFFGGPPGVAEAACHKLNEEATGLRCVGFDDAGFGSVEEMSDVERISRINRSGAHFVVVALGAPKGQAWIERNARVLDAPLLCHLGAVVNFVAGRVRRAPVWVQHTGMEWLWRIKEEPVLWRRYAGDGLALLRLLGNRLPRLGALRRRAFAAGDAQLEVVQKDPGQLRLRLTGVWRGDVLAPLRRQLADAAGDDRTVILLLRDVVDIDSAFIALLMLAYGALGSARLQLHEVSPHLGSIFWYNGARFLLGQSGTGVHP
jgi:N-acetylglucosaminyldiphosphoundecaprenol N-acetyl-beta-D-mannosaminyltransferase